MFKSINKKEPKSIREELLDLNAHEFRQLTNYIFDEDYNFLYIRFDLKQQHMYHKHFNNLRIELKEQAFNGLKLCHLLILVSDAIRYKMLEKLNNQKFVLKLNLQKVYVYDRTRTKICCFCRLSIRYDCLARHKLTKKCTIIKNLLKQQLALVEAGIKIVIPDVGTNERKNKKDPNKKQSKKTRKKKPIEVE